MASAEAEALAAAHNAVVGAPKAGDNYNAAHHIKAFIERVERLAEEKAGIADDIKDVFAEAKGNGFDVKALRDVIRQRKQNKDERDEHEALVEAYKLALGMI